MLFSVFFLLFFFFFFFYFLPPSFKKNIFLQVLRLPVLLALSAALLVEFQLYWLVRVVIHTLELLPKAGGFFPSV